jgi:hypothetical protein
VLAYAGNRFVERNGVTRQQLIEQDAGLPGTSRAGARAPASPDSRTAVEKVPLDDSGQIGTDAAAALELAKDLVVVVDDFEVDGRLKLLDRIRPEPVAATDELDDLIDDDEMIEEVAFE